MTNTIDLRTDFPPVPKSEWIAKIEKDLKGKSLTELELRLDGQELSPFPHAEDLKDLPPPTAFHEGWEIGEDIPSHDLLEANRQARSAITQGVEAPRFILDENLGDHRMAALLEGLDLKAVSIHFFEKNKNADPRHLLEHVCHTAKDLRLDPLLLRGSVNWAHEESVVMQDALEVVETAQHKLPGFSVLPVNGRAYFQEGAAVKELAEMINKAVWWIDGLEAKGIPVEEVNRYLFFSISIGKNYFIEIAKVRALRLLWANVLKAYGADVFSMPAIEAHTVPPSSGEDSNKNMIQSTTQAMAAIIGGVNRLTIIPVNGGENITADFSRRIARNVQHILKMESHFDWVNDPAAGSYFIENLTSKLAAAAWEVFQEM